MQEEFLSPVLYGTEKQKRYFCFCVCQISETVQFIQCLNSIQKIVQL